MIRISDYEPSYPPMEHGFPRRYIDITPQEILYDPTRVLGSQCPPARTMVSTGRTVVRQPRLETTAYRYIDGVDFVYLMGAGTHGKPGPLVIVYTPEAERTLREMYPGMSYNLLRLY